MDRVCAGRVCAVCVADAACALKEDADTAHSESIRHKKPRIARKKIDLETVVCISPTRRLSYYSFRGGVFAKVHVYKNFLWGLFFRTLLSVILFGLARLLNTVEHIE